jgi:hypothetical protein
MQQALIILNLRYFGKFWVTVTQFFPGHCPDHRVEMYDNLYSGTGGVVEDGRDCSL